MIAGPGAIASIILLTNDARENSWQFVGVFCAMFAVISAVVALFMLAGVIERVLGKIGILVVSRLFGMLLAALAVQFILNGLTNFGIAIN